MRVTIEKVENGFLVVHETAQARKVFIVSDAANVVQFVKDLVDPSPVQVANDRPLVLA